MKLKRVLLMIVTLFTILDFSSALESVTGTLKNGRHKSHLDGDSVVISSASGGEPVTATNWRTLNSGARLISGTQQTSTIHPYLARMSKLTASHQKQASMSSISTSTIPAMIEHKHQQMHNDQQQHQHQSNPSTHELHHQTHIQIHNHQQQNSQSKQLSHSSNQKKLLEKICTGTTYKLSATNNKSEHYQNLVDRYKDCTYVIGNLELTWLEANMDLGFLESIRGITGYLLIANVQVEHMRLPNLQIIRGRELFRYNNQSEDEFALILIDNELRTLQLPQLSEILYGSIGSYNNRNLCHLRTISWDEIINPTYRTVMVYNTYEPECPACDISCSGSCWAEGPQMCQRFSKFTCADQCGQGRCFGPAPTDCCHSFCAGGCTGPKQTDCLACKNFYDDGACVQECPSMMRYNSNEFVWEPNPKGKYAFGATCVKDCPEHLLRDNGACVRTCPLNKRSVNRHCVECAGPCPKNCQGVEVVHSANIDQLINCTVIEGSISITDASFTGNIIDPTSPCSITHSSSSSSSNSSSSCNNVRYKPMHPNRLEAFATLREITGHLSIQGSHPDFKNLSAFRNLKYIGGRQTPDELYSLSITKSSLVSLNLHSLRKVRSGKILIEDNKHLCFADTIDWTQTNITRSRDEIITRNNAESSKCRALGLQCHEQCARDGCWGPGPDECLSCNNFKLDDYCVDNCNSTLSQVGFLSFVNSSRTCKKCHSECKLGCDGEESKQCWSCKNVRDGPHCVPDCPSHKYNKQGICMECDRSCTEGCTGPSNKLGPDGCNSCAKAVITNNDGPFVAHCIKAEDPCPDGFYQEYVGPQAEGPLKSSSGKPICRRCHPRCKTCIGMGLHTSVCECAKHVAGEQCEDSCPRDFYPDEHSRHCLKCSSECNGCTGPTEADCKTCRVYRIYHAPTNLLHEATSQNGDAVLSSFKFNCTANCPTDKPHRISGSNMLDPYCSEDPGVDSDGSIKSSLVTAYFAILVVIIGAVMGCLSISRFQAQNDKTFKLTMHLSGIDDVEPLHPSNMKPNLAPLRSIKETELRKGKILGSGFGGTVYQGLWFPEGREHKKPWPVAIKVLRDNGQSNMNKEFLDEAYIMASVNHPNLVRLLAVCMTPSHLMLVTQLMPLGCLLDYVKKNKNEMGAKNLLEWCKQIAKGMAYLEERRMVHRDLALRNVLLQKSGRALVSDFGLAKFLEVDQSEYHSGGGRLPIKWLAPECIRERKFTHKSDVWAFGVTIWELLTFGMRPFEEYETRDVPMAVEKGARLQQPPHMSAEVYKVMYSCWFYNPDDRPNFKTLVQNFINFARDPERYLICGSKGIEYNNNMNTIGMSNNSDVDDEYSSDINSSTEDDSSQPPSAGAMAPELTPSTHNRLNEIFGFEMRNNQTSLNNNINGFDSESDTHPMTTPICKSKMGNMFPAPSEEQDVFISKVNNSPIEEHIDVDSKSTSSNNTKTNNSSNGTNKNNNNITNNNHVSVNRNTCWSMSSTSLTHASDQPTDGYDYLLPSPSTNCESHMNHFNSFYASNYTSPSKSTPITPTLAANQQPIPASLLPMHLRNPPHSAGPIGVNNEEYFINAKLNMVNYKNINGHHEPKYPNRSQLSASNSNIPQSLV